jgi:outer membrane protein assembly factor BamB
MRLLLAAALAFVGSTSAREAVESAGQSWPSFRGPRASGVLEGRPTPAKWNVATGEGVRFRVAIPGLAHSSPVVWGDSVYLTSAVASGEPVLKVGLYGDIESVPREPAHRYVVYRIDKRTGQVRWERTAHEGVPRRPRHPKSTHANPTPATDGRRVVAFFGSEGLYCYDVDGNLLWKKDLGPLDAAFFVAPDAQWGVASSPIIHEGVVYLQCDVLNDPFLAAFDLETGKERWRTPRKDVPTWSTPTIQQAASQTLLVVNGWKHIGAYDTRTGQEVWKLKGGGDIPVPAPVVADDLAFITNAHGPGSPIFAVRASARGDISLADGKTESEHIAWSVARGGNYMQTPLVYGNLLYTCRDNGVLSVFRARTGERLYQERLGAGSTGFSASPVAADGKVYFTSEEGDVFVVRAGESFELLSKNALGEITMASPAISEGVLYFRTKTHLVAIGGPAAR